MKLATATLLLVCAPGCWGVGEPHGKRAHEWGERRSPSDVVGGIGGGSIGGGAVSGGEKNPATGKDTCTDACACLEQCCRALSYAPTTQEACGLSPSKWTPSFCDDSLAVYRNVGAC